MTPEQLQEEIHVTIVKYHDCVEQGELGAALIVREDLAKLIIKHSSLVLLLLEERRGPHHAQEDNTPDCTEIKE